MKTIIVTRHPSLVTVLHERGIAPKDAQVLEHASLGDVKGKHVIGVLPHHLSCAAELYTEVKMLLSREDRESMQRGDLDIEATRRAAGEAVEYQVFGGSEKERADKMRRACGYGQQRLLAELYKHLARLNQTGAKSIWGGLWRDDSTRAYRALHAARSWIPYDLMGPGPYHTDFTEADVMRCFRGKFTAHYSAGDDHVCADAHRGGLVRICRMSDATPWVDVDTLEPTDPGGMLDD